MEKDLTEKERQLKLLRNQYESIKGHVKKIKDMKQSRCIEVFQMRNIISGPKKAGQEATAVKDFKMGELVVNKEAIKKASLEYCLNVLKKNELDEDFKSQHKHKEDFLKDLFKEKDDEEELSKDDYCRILYKLNSKNKKSYDFITKVVKITKKLFLVSVKEWSTRKKSQKSLMKLF